MRKKTTFTKQSYFRFPGNFLGKSREFFGFPSFLREGKIPSSTFKGLCLDSEEDTVTKEILGISLKNPGNSSTFKALCLDSVRTHRDRKFLENPGNY